VNYPKTDRTTMYGNKCRDLYRKINWWDKSNTHSKL